MSTYGLGNASISPLGNTTAAVQPQVQNPFTQTTGGGFGVTAQPQMQNPFTQPAGGGMGQPMGLGQAPAYVGQQLGNMFSGQPQQPMGLGQAGAFAGQQLGNIFSGQSQIPPYMPINSQQQQQALQQAQAMAQNMQQQQMAQRLADRTSLNLQAPMMPLGQASTVGLGQMAPQQVAGLGSLAGYLGGKPAAGAVRPAPSRSQVSQRTSFPDDFGFPNGRPQTPDRVSSLTPAQIQKMMR
jgi:hypothetical protein